MSLLQLATVLVMLVHSSIDFMLQEVQHQQLAMQMARLQPQGRPTQLHCPTLGPQALVAMLQGAPLQV